MRSGDELERAAFTEPLTAEEDDALVTRFMERAAGEPRPREKHACLKQAAFFAGRAFEKGSRQPEVLRSYIELLTQVQRTAPSDSFRRRLAEMKSTLAGKGTSEGVLKRLGRAGVAGSRKLLATDDQLDAVERSLALKLPPSYRSFLKRYAHRQVGTYEPHTAVDLEAAAREAWAEGLEPYLLPILEDNADRFCFDLRSRIEEPPIVYCPHDGTSAETWPNFATWVEECWLAEMEE